jgi:hypothetical protein
LLVATFSTLFFVPLFFSVLRRKSQARVKGEQHVDS